MIGAASKYTLHEQDLSRAESSARQKILLNHELYEHTALGKELSQQFEKAFSINAEFRLAEIICAWNRSFNTVFNWQSSQLQQRLLNFDNVLYRLDQGSLIGVKLISSLLAEIAGRSIMLTESAPFESLKTHLGDFGFPRKPRLIFIDEIKSAQDLESIIHKTKQAASRPYLLGIGGGRTLDYLKFIGRKTGRPMLAIPTSLTTHVYASSKIHALPPIQQMGYTHTIDGAPPHVALLDLDFLRSVYARQPRLVMTGFGDLLAFFTAHWDWQLAVRQGKSKDNSLVADLIKQALERLDNIDLRRPFDEWVYDYTFVQVLLCHITDWAGSAPASGSEHLFAKCAEEAAAPLPLHGELVALGALIFAHLQGQNLSRLLALMEKFSLPRSLTQVGIDREQAVRALLGAKEAGRQKNRFTIVETLDFTEDHWRKLLAKLIADGVIYD